MAYTGVSIVDYLNSIGQPSDYNSRATLAAQQGITNYTGTAAQNTQLLGILRSLNKPITTAPVQLQTPVAPNYVPTPIVATTAPVQLQTPVAPNYVPTPIVATTAPVQLQTPVAPIVVPTPTQQPEIRRYLPNVAYTGVSIVDYLNSIGQPSDYNSRATLAAQQGITNYTGTAAQNTQLLGILRSLFLPYLMNKPITTAPVQNNISSLTAKTNELLRGNYFNTQTGAAMSTEKLQTSVAPITVSTPTPQPDTSGALVAGATQTSNDIQKYLDAIKTAKTPEQTQTDVLTARINELLPQTAGKAQELATQESNLGVTAKTQELANVNSQILTKTAEYNQLKTSYDQTSVENRGKPITMNSIIGNEAQIQYARNSALNTKAADIGLLQAQALGLQGQIDAGKAAAKQAVDLKYATVQDEINIKTQQLALIQPTLTAQEKTKADAITYALTQQQNELDVRKANEKDKNSTLLNLIQLYPDANINLSSDTIESANQKITANSKIYADKIAPPVSTLSTTLTPVQKSNLQTYLANQGLPLTIASISGELTTSALNSIVQAGVPLNTAQGIWTNIKAGNSFEEIRQGIKNQGGDPAILDKFVVALQGKATTSGEIDFNNL